MLEEDVLRTRYKDGLAALVASVFKMNGFVNICDC